MQHYEQTNVNGTNALLAAVFSKHEPQPNDEAQYNAQPGDQQTLTQQLKTLAQALDRGTCKLILLLPEFDRQECWAMDGQRSCVAWLNAYCGISPSAAHDRRRVAYALEELPVLLRLFKIGELSWSKVRALTRIATPENERALAGQALMMSASAIELMARQYRGISTPENTAEEDAKACEQYQKRRVNYGFDSTGMVSITASLPPLEGAAVLKSLARAEDQLFIDAQGKPKDSSSPTAFIAADSEHGIHRTSTQLRADALSLMAMKHLAAEHVEIRTADRYQVVVHIDENTLTQHSGAPLSSTKCHIENGPALAASTVRRLADDCSVVPIFMKHGEPMSIGRKSRVWPSSISRAITTRDQHCQFPHCTASRHMHIHHLKHWADGGNTSVSNGVLLCAYHHRLVHEEQYVIEKTLLDEHGKLPIKTIKVQSPNNEELLFTAPYNRFVVRRPDGSVLN